MPWSPRRIAFLLAMSLVALSCDATAADFAVLHRFPLPGDGGWDYLVVDAPSNRLFIARGDRVQVVDVGDGSPRGEIAGTPGVHGVALATDLGKGYTSNGRDHSLTVFDLASLKVLAKIDTPAGENPDAIVYESSSRRVVAFNGRSHDATLVDATSDRVVATVALRGKPESAAVDGRGRVFVAIENTNEVSSIDARTGNVVATWPLPGCDEPTGLAIDVASQRLFVGCHNATMVVVDATDGRIVAKLPIGQGVDAAAFDPATRLVFSSQSDGTLTIVGEDASGSFAVRQTVATQRGARTMALHAENHRVYLVSATFDEAPSPDGQRPRRTMRPGTFTLLVVGAPQ